MSARVVRLVYSSRNAPPPSPPPPEIRVSQKPRARARGDVLVQMPRTQLCNFTVTLNRNEKPELQFCQASKTRLASQIDRHYARKLVRSSKCRRGNLSALCGEKKPRGTGCLRERVPLEIIKTCVDIAWQLSLWCHNFRI